MKKILLLSALTAFTATSDAFADARKFNGFHVGAELGAGAARFGSDSNINQNVDPAFANAVSNRGDISGTGAVGGINLGYGMVHAPSHVYFGLNITANLSSLKGNQKSSADITALVESDFNIKNSFSADFRLGYAFESALVYGLIGVISSKLEADSKVGNPVAGPDLGEYGAGSSSNRKTGLLLGLGVEVPVAERFSIGGEYRYARYSDVKYDVKINNAVRFNAIYGNAAADGDVFTSQKVKPSSHSFVVTAKYRF